METLDYLRHEVQARRKHHGMRQEDLARLAHVSLFTLQAFEQGRLRELGFGKLARILTAVGLELRVQEANRGRPTLDQLQDEQKVESTE